jgi:hypothetical protein
MAEFNLYALLGIPFGVLFIINGLWDKSPFMIPYFRRLQERRIGAEALKFRMAGTGAMILTASVLAFFKIILK